MTRSLTGPLILWWNTRNQQTNPVPFFAPVTEHIHRQAPPEWLAMLRRFSAFTLSVGVMSAVFVTGLYAADDGAADTLLRRAEESHVQGRYELAESLYREALTVHEQVAGDEPGVIRILNGLTDLLHTQGREKEAETVCRRALDLGQSSLDPISPTLGFTLNYLGEIYRSTHRYVGAEPLYRRALAILEASLGPAHLWVGRVLNNLASLQVDTRHFDEAEKLFQRALEISEKIGGGDTSQVVIILNNIAVCAMERDRFAVAERNLLRAIRIRDALAERDDPALISVLETYSLLLRRTRRTSKAKQLDARIAFVREHSESPK